ncbi:MAG: alpha/beta fold hydrolase [Candidatus Dormibacterales bacterium]
MKLVTVLLAAALVVGACSSSSTTAGVSVLGASLPKCADDPTWRCGTVTVPLDRANPGAGMLKVAFFVQAHLDTTRPALEPIFVSPGGPGASIWADHGYLPLLNWDVRHDTVLVEPRGVGLSGAIVCQELQSGTANFADLRKATADCGRQLGAAASQYDTGDVALDIDDVRKALGVDSFDLYSASYATITEQAYVTRFPNHVHALVLDSGFAITNSGEDVLGIGYAAAWIRVASLVCQRSADCSGAYSRPQDLIRWLITRVAASPIHGSVAGSSASLVADEAAIESLLPAIGPKSAQLQPKTLLDAITALRAGDSGPLLQVVAQWGQLASGTPDPGFSAGDSSAVYCNDQVFPWAQSDSLAVREQKVAAAYAALPANAFDPFTTAGWAAGNPGPDICITWPSPKTPEPVIPAGAKYPSLPTLIMSGDQDMNAPEEISRILLKEFPSATFLVVAGAGHDSAAPGWTSCGGQAVATFFDTLRVDPAACATYKG